MRFKNFILMCVMTLSFTSLMGQTYLTSAETGATVGYKVVVTDTIPEDSTFTESISGLYSSSAMEELMSENLRLQNANLDLVASLSSSADSLTSCQEILAIVSEQQTDVLEAVNQLSTKIAEQTPRSNVFGFGVGYYTEKQFDVTGQFYLGESLITAGYIFDDATDLSIRVGVGQQMTNRFTVVATTTFNRVDDEGVDNSYGIDVQYRILGDLNFSLGVDTQREIRIGALYNL